MKIRTDFVTNSSSSSFICEICNNSESGWDMSITDTHMVECTKGHCLCKSHIPNEDFSAAVAQYAQEQYRQECKDKKSDIEPLDPDDYDEYMDDFAYSFPAEFCPICSLKEIPDYIILQTIYQEIKKTPGEMKDWVRAVKRREAK